MPYDPIFFDAGKPLISPDLMRRLDRWIGIPCCSGMTRLCRVRTAPLGAVSGVRRRVCFHAGATGAGLPCFPCVIVSNQRQTRCRDKRCMHTISVDTVPAAVEAILADPAKPSNAVPLWPAAASSRRRKQA